MRAAPTIGPYKQGPTLGQGQFGKVKVGEHVKTHTKVALKIVPDEKADKEKLQKEIDLQRKLDHKHVVRLHDVIQQKDATVIAMELVPGGDLLEYLLSRVRLPEDEARRLFQQLIAALQHCHSHGVVHRDVKPENILLDGQLNVKLCDFGLAAEFSDDVFLTESCGSPNYAAPELLVKHCKYRGPEVDVWSCGVVLFALLCNNLPFDAGNVPDLFKQIRGGRYRVPGYVSAEARDLIDKILTVTPSERITLPEIVRHPWFARNLPLGLCDPGPEASAAKSAEERSGQTAPAAPALAAEEEEGQAAAASRAAAAPAAEGPGAPARTPSAIALQRMQAGCRDMARSRGQLEAETRNVGLCGP